MTHRTPTTRPVGWLAISVLLSLAVSSACDFEPDPDDDCSLGTGASCDDGAVCVQGRCVSELDQGVPCKLGTPESGATPCKAGLSCQGQVGTLTCQPVSGQAERCLQDVDCDGALVCRRRAPGADTTCQSPAAFGGYCEASADCEAPLRCRGSDVDGSRGCAAAAVFGEACASSDACADGLSCNAGVCG